MNWRARLLHVLGHHQWERMMLLLEEDDANSWWLRTEHCWICGVRRR